MSVHDPAPLTIPRLLAARAETDPDRPALVADGLGDLTFGQWERRSDAAARGLLDLGLRHGDRIGLLFGGDEWTEFAVAFCAVLKAGGVAVPLSARLSGHEVLDTLGRCAATGVLHGPGTPALQDPGRWWTTTPETAGGSPAGVEVRPGDLAQIIYTSGTTGTPKGVGATHANLTHGRSPYPRRRAYSHSERFLHAFPIGTNAAQMMLMDALTAHPAALTLPGFEPEEFCRLIEAHRVGTVFLVPSMAIELLGSGAHRRHDLSSVLLLSSSAAALPPSVAQDLAAAFAGATLVNYYTSTEAVPAQTTMIVDPARPTSLGRATDLGDLRILGPDGRTLPPGETGEVWLRSPAAPRSYVGDPEGSALVFRDGWVRMGDIGHLDADGYLYLSDRESDVIKSGALKVSTVQIEAALHEHPAVAEAAVVGVPHPVMGAMPAAAVRLAHPVPVDEIRDFLSTRLARHELPTRIVVVDSFPRNDIGKILKSGVRDLFAARGRRVPLTSEQETRLAVPRTREETVRVAMRVRDAVDPGVLRRALREVAATHEALRLTFPSAGGAHVAEIAPEIEPDLVRLPSAGHPGRAAGQDAGPAPVDGRAGDDPAGDGERVERESGRPFDLERGPLFRAILTGPSADGCLLVLCASPLVCDAWSLDTVLYELGTAYAAALVGRASPAPAATAGYADWAAHRRSADASRQRALAPPPPPGPAAPHPDPTGPVPSGPAASHADPASSVPSDPAASHRDRPAPVPSGPAVPYGFRLPPEVAGRLRQTARACRTTPATVALVCWAATVSLVEEVPDPVVLVREPGRVEPAHAGMVGPLALDVPVRIALPGGLDDPSDLLRTVESAATRPSPPSGPHTARFLFEGFRPEPYLPGLKSEPHPLPVAAPADGRPLLTLTEQPDGSMSGVCAGPAAERLGRRFRRLCDDLPVS
ncbi:AMP-binding protein [Streptosporangium canum]|uniref:AMP-binding protein n=1 Tax=Streptosporangium canum TaxID=324952 RepID=UPI00369FD115